MPSVPSESVLLELSPLNFRTAGNAEAQGANPRTGFGGFSIAVALRAACSSVDSSAFALYSALGHFLGPTDGRKPIYARVTALRDTRTFATRRVDLLQDQDADASGSGPAQRLTMTITADFMKPEPRSFYTYSRRPRADWSPPEDSLDMEKVAQEEGGEAWREKLQAAATPYRFVLEKFDKRFAPQGWFGQVKGGVHVPDRVLMDDVPPADRGSGEWYRPKESLDSYVDTLLSFAYILDSGISIDTTFWNRLARTDLAAVSSLEFALRFFTNDYCWRNEWLLRESFSHEAGTGRAYNEALLRTREGKVLVSMTQQTIVRPKADARL